MNGKLVLGGIVGTVLGLFMMLSGHLPDSWIGVVLFGLGLSSFNAGWV